MKIKRLILHFFQKNYFTYKHSQLVVVFDLMSERRKWLRQTISYGMVHNDPLIIPQKEKKIR